MTKHLISLALFALSLAAQADTWVNGYVKHDGTYVSGHYLVPISHSVEASNSGFSSSKFQSESFEGPASDRKSTSS